MSSSKVAVSLCAVLLAGTVLTLAAGCVTQTSRSAIQGDFGAVAEGTEGQSETDLSLEDHYNICKAYQQLQRFSDLDRCMEALWPRIRTEEFSVGGGIASYNEDYAEILLHSIEGNKYLELGDYGQAYFHAEQAVAAAHRNPRTIFNSGLSAMTSILTFGLNNPNEEGGPRDEIDKRTAKIEPYGLMAIAASLQGDEVEAQRYRDGLHEIYDETGKSEIEAQQGLNLTRRWLGQSYFVAGKYEEAYLAFTRDDRSAGTKALDGIMGALLAIEKPILEPMAYAVSGTSFDDMAFAQEFPLEVMVARAAFKTGRQDIARDAYDQILAEPRVAGFGSMHFRLLQERAQIALIDGDRATARDYYDRAIQVLESQRARLKEEDYKLGFVGDKNDIYAEIVTLLIEGGDNRAAFEYAERAKARAMVGMLASRHSFSTGSNVAAAGLFEELDALEQQSIQVAALDSGVAAATIQARLDPDEALLEFYGQGDDLYAFAVSQHGVEAVTLDGTGLTQAVADYRAAVQDWQSQAYLAAGRAMYDRLIGPRYRGAWRASASPSCRTGRCTICPLLRCMTGRAS